MLKNGKSFLALCLSILVLLSPVPGFGQEQPTDLADEMSFDMLVLPEFEVHLELNKVCYDFAGAQELAAKDREFHKVIIREADCSKRAKLLGDEVVTLQRATLSLQADLDEAEDNLVVAFGLLHSAEEQNLKLMNRPHPAVVVLAIAGAFLGGAGIGMGVGIGVGLGSN